MRALVLANRGDDDAGVVGEHLERQGVSLVPAGREQPTGWPDLAGIDLVVSLGSDWSVYWDHVAANVAAEAALLVEAHRRDVAVFGICYGGQILAHALGGTVAPAPQPEIGWYGVESPVPALRGDGPWFQWHVDRFSPPPGSTTLATSARAVQAFRAGRALGVQFHPEVGPEIVARWAAEGADELRTRGMSPGALVAATEEHARRAGAAARRLVDWFLAEVAGSSLAPRPCPHEA